MENKFAKYGISADIVEALTMLKYLEPTPVQEQVIPLILKGRDVVAKSKTGSGKTAAFAVPICEEIDWLQNHPQALILEPTRELAAQVREEIFCIGRKKRIKVPALIGGFPIEKQILTMKQKSHIVVGTPGRVLDHLKRGSLHVDNVKYLVIDEADLMLQMGFKEDVEMILGYLPEVRVNMLFSATLGEHVQGLVEKYLHNPVEVKLEEATKTAAEVRESGYYISNEEKFRLLIDILIDENPSYCMIFCGTREMVNVLYRQMKKVRIRCGMLHGQLEQKERLQTIDAFREGKFTYLISTDVAARGIDFDNISHVINYDLPTDKENYVHRIGRTGRNGNTGRAISFIQPSESNILRTIEVYTGAKVSICEENEKDINAGRREAFFRRQREKVILKEKKGAVFKKDIMSIRISGGKKSKIRTCNIVATICGIDGIAADDIGIIDIRDSLTYVEILNGKGKQVLEALPGMTIKGKVRNIKRGR